MLLAADVGNTEIVLGVFRGEEARERGSLRALGDRAIDPRFRSGRCR